MNYQQWIDSLPREEKPMSTIRKATMEDAREFAKFIFENPGILELGQNVFLATHGGLTPEEWGAKYPTEESLP